MGGYGSGRQRWRNYGTVEGSRSLDVNKLNRAGCVMAVRERVVAKQGRTRKVLKPKKTGKVSRRTIRDAIKSIHKTDDTNQHQLTEPIETRG